MSAGSDDTSLPAQPRGSVLGKDVEAKLEALSAGTTKARTERMNASAAKRAEKNERKKKAAAMVASATKALGRLTRDQELDEQAKIVDRIAMRGLKLAEGLLMERGEEGYNPDADVPVPEATMRSHTAVKVYAQMMANKRDNNATARALGVVLLQGRMNEADWNAEAQRVDEEQRRAHAITVAAEMVAEDGE